MYPPYTYVFENELIPTMATQQKQHVDGVGCYTCLSGLISMFCICPLQISSEWFKFCKPPPSPLRSGLVTRLCARQRRNHCQILGRPALRNIQVPFQCVSKNFRQEYSERHVTLDVMSKIRICGAATPASVNVNMAWYLLKYRANFETSPFADTNTL